MVNVALRTASLFARTETVTEPLPVPLPSVTVIQPGAELVVHAHPRAVVTATVLDPPAAVGLKLVGLMA
jgi:quercetin dioxygenase-like cupin family protein